MSLWQETYNFIYHKHNTMLAYNSYNLKKRKDRMKNQKKSFLVYTLLSSCLLSSALSAVDVEQLAKDVEMLKEQNDRLKMNKENNSKSGFQIAGYAAFDYVDDEFSGVKFAPIFHAKYGDIFQFEGELEFTMDPTTGETVTALEYAAGTIFLNNYMGLQVGKFMSPIGQFVQNQHPSWINKMAMAPLGFGHDGAAPTSNVGMALRGGLPKVASLRSNYVLFVSNAPVYGKNEDGSIEGSIDAEGKTTSNSAKPTVGARYALNPISQMEIGISGAVGDIVDVDNIKSVRDYTVVDVDFMYNYDALSLKAEYVKQSVGTSALSTIDPDGGDWEAWYAQASYQFSAVALEPVLRYSDYHNPETKRNQLALGLNYLLSNNLIVKLSYELNENEDASVASDDVTNNDIVRAQLAFGF